MEEETFRVYTPIGDFPTVCKKIIEEREEMLDASKKDLESLEKSISDRDCPSRESCRYLSAYVKDKIVVLEKELAYCKGELAKHTEQMY